jgi:hypothetical protein
VVVLRGPADQNRSEPHIAVDPEDPDRMYVVAQGALPRVALEPQLFWQTDDGGATWSDPLLMGYIDNTERGAAGDPVVAAGTGGVVLFGTLAVLVDGDPPRLTDNFGTLTAHIGTRVSADHGHTFPSFGSADHVVSTGATPETIDKEWLAVDTSGGPFAGAAYLAWVHFRPDGSEDLFLAASRDGGRTYGAPYLLEHLAAGQLEGEVEEYVQVVVRPDGTVDAIWNTVRDGVPVTVQASSTDGGASFSTARPIVLHDTTASAVGMVLSLAVSPSGRLGLCWPQSRPGPAYDPRVLCQVTDNDGQWGAPEAALPDPSRQYLPATTFHGETLWLSAYESDSSDTRVVAVPRDPKGFGSPVTLAEWPVPSDRICAPHPPDCGADQTFIGDYVGAVATAERLVVTAIEPVVGGRNRAVVLRLPLPAE